MKMEKPLKWLALCSTFFVYSGSFAQTTVSGAGASFPAPLYQRWAQDFNKASGVQISYQSVGSGAGVKQFTQELVDFGGSDAAMTDAELAKVKRGAVLLPVTAGSIVLAYNLPGVPDLKLSRQAYVDIFLGKITKWNDPAIAKSNAGVTLPDLPITVATRSDGSGTTFVFTKHLSAISPEFNEKVGTDKAVTWPVGVAGKGNDGVTNLIKQNAGAVGYIEYGYADLNKLATAALENKAGKFIKATPESGASTLANVELPANLRVWPEDPKGESDYPIATFTWLMVYKQYPDANKMKAIKDFVTYGIGEGQKVASTLGYIPLPDAVVKKVQAALVEVK